MIFLFSFIILDVVFFSFIDNEVGLLICFYEICWIWCILLMWKIIFIWFNFEMINFVWLSGFVDFKLRVIVKLIIGKILLCIWIIFLIVWWDFGIVVIGNGLMILCIFIILILNRFLLIVYVIIFNLFVLFFNKIFCVCDIKVLFFFY